MKKTKILNYLVKDQKGVLYLYGEIGERERVDSERVATELAELEQQTTEIEVRINSRGGEVYEGIAIFNALRRSNAKITIFVDGVAASIAAVIALCGKPLKMAQNSRLMLHNVSGGAYGTAEELEKIAKDIRDVEKTLANMVSARCKMTPAEFESKYFNGNDNWLSAEECVKMGLACEIYEFSGDLGENVPTGYNYTNKQKKAVREVENSLSDAISLGIIKAEDKTLYLSLSKTDQTAFENLMNEKRKLFEKEVKNEVEKNLNYKIKHSDFEFYQMIGRKLGVDGLKKVLSNQKPFELISNYLNGTPQPNWTLEDYRKFNPLFLLDNPEFYAQLKKKYGEPQKEDMLDYYRKNNPEYLKENPEVFKELVNKKFNQ